MEIYERLFIIMERKNIKAATLANALNINKSSVSRWKSEKRNPPIEHTVAICKLLEITPQYLLTGEENDTETDDPKEQHLLNQYRKLNDRYQSKLVDTADDYVLLPGALRELNAESSGCKIS